MTSARLSAAREAEMITPADPVRGRPWKADGYTDRATGSDAVRYASVDTATYQLTVTHADTRRDKKETARVAENSQPADRFPRMWQVLGSNQRRLSRRVFSVNALTHGTASELRKYRNVIRFAVPLSAICPCGTAYFAPMAPKIHGQRPYSPLTSMTPRSSASSGPCRPPS